MGGKTESVESAAPDRTPFASLEKHVVFTDLSVFDTDYIPDHIFMRKEFAPVIRFYFDAVKFRLQQCLVIIGPSGSGKTLACRYYGKEALAYARNDDVNFAVAYINCREIASIYAFWQFLLRNFEIYVPKGFSVTDLIDRFATAVAKHAHVVVILDELEKLYANLGNDRVNDILYVLARMRSTRNLKAAISLVLISNNVHLANFFDAPVKSSLNTINLAIGNYNAEELEAILRNRAEAGLKPGKWSPAALKYVAAKTVQYNSDARFAIRLLRNAASLMEGDKQAVLGTLHVDKAFEDTRREAEMDVVNRLSTSQLLVLRAIALAARRQPSQFITLHSVYKGDYASVCDGLGRKPLVYSQFLCIVRSLQSYDLVNNILERRRSGGYIRLIEANFNPQATEQAIKERLEQH